MKQNFNKDICKIDNVDDKGFEYQKEIVNYLTEYDRFLYKVALSVKNKCRKLEVEDIKQQIILVLLMNCENYRSDVNVKNSSYYSRIVINAANNIVKRYWQEKNRINVCCVSLDAFVADEYQNYQFITLFKEDDDSLLYPANMYTINEFNRKVKNVNTYLSSFERKVFMMYLQGKDINQISAKLKKNRKTIYNALAIVREKIKEEI
jgi:RNA polymerase sigma factor (sigma-70 family)